MQIRRATEADAEAMGRLWDEFTVETTYTPYPGAPFEPTLLTDHLALVAEEDGEPLGSVYANVSSPHFGFVFGLYTRPEVRGRGVARALMRAIAEALHEGAASTSSSASAHRTPARGRSTSGSGSSTRRARFAWTSRTSCAKQSSAARARTARRSGSPAGSAARPSAPRRTSARSRARAPCRPRAAARGRCARTARRGAARTRTGRRRRDPQPPPVADPYRAPR